MKACWCFLIVLLSACTQDVKMVAVPDANRRWTHITFDTAWIVGGNARDSILSYPARLTSLGDLVIVSDPGKHRLVALRTADGTIAWINGPEEGHGFRRPLVMWTQPGNRIGVVDEEEQRLTTIDANGRTVSEVDLDGSRLVQGACGLEGHGTLVTSVDDRGPLYYLAADARTATPVPMSVLGAREHNPLVLQPTLESNRDWTQCVVAMSLGGGLALWNGSTFTAEALYRERIPVPTPTIRRQTRSTDSGTVEESYPVLPRGAVVSAIDVASMPGRVRVLFGGTSTNRERIIDDYDDRTLEYLGSTLLPARASAIATPRPGLLVVLGKQHGYPVVVALRERVTAP